EPNWIGWLFPLFGLPFLLGGLYLLVGRFLVDARRRARTCYGLTDRRIIILTPGLFGGRQVQSLDLATLGKITLTERANGYGTITFGTEFDWLMRNRAWGAFYPFYLPPMFEMIPDARQVYNLIRRQQQEARPGR
ncbi:MAG: hypothetical protein GXO37_05130, partial [Chloroflexi bacterium]|nr:hypothetical protein [Chloroflexota bacterium]